VKKLDLPLIIVVLFMQSTMQFIDLQFSDPSSQNRQKRL